MIFRIKLNLLEIKNHTFTENIDLAFDNTQNFEYCAESDVEHITKLHLYCTPNSVLLDVYLDYEEEPDYNFDGSDIEQFSINNEFVIFDATIDDSDIATLYQFYEMGLIEFVLDAQTLLFVYKQNSDNEHLNKSLTFVNILQGEFNHSIGVKNINVDIHNFELNFNYVFMPNLNRYYYVDSVEIVSADISRLHLKEDVLMTWKSLIYRQKGLISRWEDSSAITLVDNRLPVEDIVTTEYIYSGNYNKQTGNQINCYIKIDKETYDFTGLMLITYAKEVLSTRVEAQAPWNVSDLPDIPALISNRIHVDFMKLEDYSYLYRACQLDDATTSYILNLMYLPIGWYGNSPYNPLGSMTRTRVVVNNKKLTQLDGFVSDNGQLDPLDVECERASVPAPYLVIAHFNYNPDNVDFTFYEPYSKYEIFIPFVGWVDINANKILNKELMIYYSLDVTTGQGSAYILSVTDSVLIWSGNCTIGVKIPLSTTNNLEKYPVPPHVTGMQCDLGTD